jgi:hypothetical protein
LLLFVVLIFAIEWNFVQWPYARAMIPVGTALATTLAVLLAILVHELAHIFAAINLGGSVQKIVLAPWGGQSEFVLPNSARAQSIVYSAGVFANAMVFAIVAFGLVQLGHARPLELMDPFHPHPLSEPIEIAVLKIFGWMNFQIAIVNCLPAYPFDASNVVRMFVWGNNKLISRHRLETAVMAMAYMVAFSLFVLAWFSQSYNEGPLQPTWAVLVCVGLVLIFASRYEFYRQTSLPDRGGRPRGHVLGDDEMIDFEAVYDDDEDGFEFEQDPNETISQWLRQKQEERHLVEVEIEKEDEMRADGILEKLYRSGKESLTEEERSVLQRVSDRLRRRRRQLPS